MASSKTAKETIKNPAPLAHLQNKIETGRVKLDFAYADYHRLTSYYYTQKKGKNLLCLLIEHLKESIYDYGYHKDRNEFDEYLKSLDFRVPLITRFILSCAYILRTDESVVQELVFGYKDCHRELNIFGDTLATTRVLYHYVKVGPDTWRNILCTKPE